LFGALLLGLLWSTLADQNHSVNGLKDYFRSAPVMVQGVISEPVQHTPGRLVMIVDVFAVGEPSSMREATGLLRLSWRGAESSVYLGDQIQVRARLRAPFGTKNPGGFDYGVWLARQGIDAVATVKGAEGVQVLSRNPKGWWESGWHQIDVWRDQVRQAALSTLDGAALGLFLGMIVGEQSYLTDEVRDPFMATGTVHILSISGSHLGLLALLSFGVVQGLVRRLPGPWLERMSCRMTSQQLAALTTIPLVLFYTAISGTHVATVRSLLMILMYLLAIWLGHERHVLIALGLSAVLVTLNDPMALQDISFQLSYGGVLAIAVALQWWTVRSRDQQTGPGKASGILAWVGGYVVISIAVTVATMPLVAFYFNQIAWLGIVCNMLIVPLVGVVLVPFGIMSAIGLLFFGGDHLPFGWGLQLGLDGLADLVALLAGFPGAEWHVASPAPLTIIGFYLVLILMLMTNRRAVQAVTLGLLIGVTGWWAWSPQKIFDPHRLRVTFLDVGQGDATVIQLPNRQTILIDGGAMYERWDMGRMVVAPFLWDQGIRFVDHVIATHPQLDHVGGLAWVLQKFQVGQYWDNNMSRAQPFWADLQQVVNEKGITKHVAWEGQNLLGSSPCSLTSLNPELPQRGSAMVVSQDTSSFNNQSVVLKLTCGKQSFLFPADVEIPTLERLRRQNPVTTARVIKIPHHGAKSSLEKSWIRRVRGEVAVASAGKGNRYGHPADVVIRTYREQGFQVFRTDQDGAVWIEADVRESSFTMHTHSERALRRFNPHNAALLVQEMDNLKQFYETVDMDTLNRVVDYLATDSPVYVIGSRLSYTFAYYLGWSLTKIRQDVRIVNGSDSTAIDWLTIAAPESLVIIIATTRYPNELIRLGKMVRRLGHTLLVIADSKAVHFIANLLKQVC